MEILQCLKYNSTVNTLSYLLPLESVHWKMWCSSLKDSTQTKQMKVGCTAVLAQSSAASFTLFFKKVVRHTFYGVGNSGPTKYTQCLVSNIECKQLYRAEAGCIRLKDGFDVYLLSISILAFRFASACRAHCMFPPMAPAQSIDLTLWWCHKHEKKLFWLKESCTDIKPAWIKNS